MVSAYDRMCPSASYHLCVDFTPLFLDLYMIFCMNYSSTLLASSIKRNFANNRGVLFALSFFGWLAFCALFQFVCYIDQRRIWKKMEQNSNEEEVEDEEEEDPHLFSEELGADETDMSAAGGGVDGATVGEGELTEPLLSGEERNSGTYHSSGLRSFLTSYRGSSATASMFMYQSGESFIDFLLIAPSKLFTSLIV